MKTYDTSDFPLAVTLSCLGYNLTSIDTTNPRAKFQFEYSDDLPDTATSFYRGAISLNPQLVLTHAKIVKGRLYAYANDRNTGYKV